MLSIFAQYIYSPAIVKRADWRAEIEADGAQNYVVDGLTSELPEITRTSSVGNHLKLEIAKLERLLPASCSTRLSMCCCGW